jgi:magnesium and cobalt transporter
VGEIDDEHDVDEPQMITAEARASGSGRAHRPSRSSRREIGMDLTAHEEIDAEEVRHRWEARRSSGGHVAKAGEVVALPTGRSSR